jgi:hypothetical protein
MPAKVTKEISKITNSKKNTEQTKKVEEPKKVKKTNKVDKIVEVVEEVEEPKKVKKTNKVDKIVEVVEEVEEVEEPKKVKKSKESKESKESKKPKKSKEPKSDDNVKRSFRAIFKNTNGKIIMKGRYCGKKPKQAAKKAHTGICKIFAKNEHEIVGQIFFAVKETTKKSNKKFYFYTGERLKLEEPLTLKMKDGKEITYNFDNNVKKAKAEDCEHLLNYEVENDEDKTITKKINSKSKTTKNVKSDEVKKSSKHVVEPVPKTTKNVKPVEEKPVKITKSTKNIKVPDNTKDEVKITKKTNTKTAKK